MRHAFVVELEAHSDVVKRVVAAGGARILHGNATPAEGAKS